MAGSMGRLGHCPSPIVGWRYGKEKDEGSEFMPGQMHIDSVLKGIAVENWLYLI